MIVLDTNVLSEPIRLKPDPLVLAWLATEERPQYITAISVGELLTGVRQLPAGKRRTGLLEAIEATLLVFSDRILSFNEPAARIYSEVHTSRRASGAPLSVEDAMIAAICRTNQASLATRNVKDFAHLGLTLINPWDGPATT